MKNIIDKFYGIDNLNLDEYKKLLKRNSVISWTMLLLQLIGFLFLISMLILALNQETFNLSLVILFGIFFVLFFLLSFSLSLINFIINRTYIDENQDKVAENDLINLNKFSIILVSLNLFTPFVFLIYIQKCLNKTNKNNAN